MFHSFSSQADRRKSGGSDFLELQFCRMPPETAIEKIIAVDNIFHWSDDFLYISGDDTNVFLNAYSHILGCGIYNNLKTGVADPSGINYYKPGSIDAIAARLLENKPADYKKLAAWLSAAKKYNGFYLLGV